MNNLHRIILYHKCVCGILLRKFKKYSKYIIKTCLENLWHIFLMCYFNLVITWHMRGWLKGQIHILKIAITIPRKRMSRVNTLHSDPTGDGRAPGGPNVKKSNPQETIECHTIWSSSLSSNLSWKPYINIFIRFQDMCVQVTQNWVFFLVMVVQTKIIPHKKLFQ